MSTRKKRRPQQQKPGTAATTGSASKDTGAETRADKTPADSKRGERPVRTPAKPAWSRTGIAIALGGALVIAVGFAAILAAANGHRGAELVALAFNTATALPILAAAFVLLETPVRLLHQERRMRITEALATGVALAFLLGSVAGIVENFNQPSVTSTGSSGSSTSSSPSPSGPAATNAPAVSPVIGKPASPVPTPVAGTAKGAPQATDGDIAIGWVAGDIVGLLICILIYPPAYRVFAPATPAKDASKGKTGGTKGTAAKR